MSGLRRDEHLSWSGISGGWLSWEIKNLGGKKKNNFHFRNCHRFEWEWRSYANGRTMASLPAVFQTVGVGDGAVFSVVPFCWSGQCPMKVGLTQM